MLEEEQGLGGLYIFDFLAFLADLEILLDYTELLEEVIGLL